MRWIALLLALGFLPSCGDKPPPASPGAPPADPAPEPESELAASERAQSKATPEAVAESSSTRDLPSACEAAAEDCVPPERFSKKVCQGKFPSLALVMMEKSAPWQHRFMRTEWLEPINAYGGPSSENWLRFGEEVVLLKGTSEYKNKSLQVTGPGDVDILRADGTCATVAEKALMDRTPGISKSAPIVWKYLEEPTREALLKDKTIATAKDAYQSACKGSSSSHPTKKCEQATGQLNQAIMRALNGGIDLPLPDKRPEWVADSSPEPAPASQEAKNE